MNTATRLTLHEGNFKKVNIQRVIEIVLVKNLKLKKAELNFEKARLEYRKARVNNQQSRYNEVEAEYDLKEAEKRYKDTRDAVIKSTVQQYIDVYLKKLNIKVKEKRVAVEKYLLEQNESQYGMDGISSINLLEQRKKYNDACFELEKIKDEYIQSLRRVEMTFDLKGSKPEFNFLEKAVVWEISEETAIDTALENSLGLQLSRKRAELVEIDEKHIGTPSLALASKIKELTSKISYLETESTKEHITSSTKETYFQFKQAVKNIDLKKESLSRDKAEYELIKKQYEAGISTKMDLLQYAARLLKVEYSYQEAIVNYYLAEHLLREALGLETGVFMDESNVN